MYFAYHEGKVKDIAKFTSIDAGISRWSRVRSLTGTPLGRQPGRHGTGKASGVNQHRVALRDDDLLAGARDLQTVYLE